jgi:hypothetical protein
LSIKWRDPVTKVWILILLGITLISCKKEKSSKASPGKGNGAEDSISEQEKFLDCDPGWQEKQAQLRCKDNRLIYCIDIAETSVVSDPKSVSSCPPPESEFKLKCEGETLFETVEFVGVGFESAEKCKQIKKILEGDLNETP